MVICHEFPQSQMDPTEEVRGGARAKFFRRRQQRQQQQV
jgi:hypothetical protein